MPFITETIDTNDAGALSSVCPVPAGVVAYQVVALTGAHTTHVLELLASLDGTNWEVVGSADVAQVAAQVHVQVAAPQVRARVKTAEGGASTCTVLIHAPAGGL